MYVNVSIFQNLLTFTFQLASEKPIANFAKASRATKKKAGKSKGKNFVSIEVPIKSVFSKISLMEKISLRNEVASSPCNMKIVQIFVKKKKLTFICEMNFDRKEKKEKDDEWMDHVSVKVLVFFCLCGCLELFNICCYKRDCS